MRWIGGGLDKRNLEVRRLGYYVVRDVPAVLVPLVGRKRLRASLKTREHRIALLRRGAALAELDAILDRARGQLEHSGWIGKAQEVQRVLAADPTIEVFGPSPVEALVDEARLSGAVDADMLRRVARGYATPLKGLVDPWLAEKDIEERSKQEYRLAVSELIAWAEASQILPVVEAFDRKAALSYVGHLKGRKMARATLGKRLSCLSSLWASLMANGKAEANHWRGHGTAAVGRSERMKEPERPFTDDEVARLLAGTTDTHLVDLMHLAALSGMRLEEMAMLQVRDFDPKDRTLAVRDPKTPASRRAVPIHPDVLARIVARVEGKDRDAFILFELGPLPKPGRQRSMPVSKRFARYREALGVDEVREGQRRSLVNFHSFRRWFITKAEESGVPESTIRAVVGHKRAGMTFGTYSGGPSLVQRRGCVEAVRVPTLPTGAAGPAAAQDAA